jgi:hypothetical protein
VTLNLNPARLAHFADWAKTLPPRPLPRTVVPVPGEYHLDYTARLARANHLEFLELADALEDPADILHHPYEWRQHEQERLAGAAGQPVARIARLWWPDPRVYLRDPEGFRQMLRPACRRCTARQGIAEPVACHLPPHLTVCRGHRLWIGPTARSHAGQLDVSQLPEIFRARRRHLALVRHHQWQLVDTAVSDATRAIHAHGWTPRQRQRLRQLAPGTWQQALPGVLGASAGCPGDGCGSSAVEIAIYPDVIQLAAHNLRAQSQARSDDLLPGLA